MSELENARWRALAAGRELTDFEVLLARAVDQGPGAPDESETAILPVRDLWDFADGHPRLAAPTRSPLVPRRGGKTTSSPRKGGVNDGC